MSKRRCLGRMLRWAISSAVGKLNDCNVTPTIPAQYALISSQGRAKFREPHQESQRWFLYTFHYLGPQFPLIRLHGWGRCWCQQMSSSSEQNSHPSSAPPNRHLHLKQPALQGNRSTKKAAYNYRGELRTAMYSFSWLLCMAMYGWGQCLCTAVITGLHTTSYSGPPTLTLSGYYGGRTPTRAETLTISREPSAM